MICFLFMVCFCAISLMIETSSHKGHTEAYVSGGVLSRWHGHFRAGSMIWARARAFPISCLNSQGCAMQKPATHEDVPRRDFLTHVGATTAVATLAAPAMAQTAASRPQNAPFVGIQMGPHTILDEGIDHVLDSIQETASVNVVIPYSHAYNGDLRKAPNVLANDHGVPVRDNRNRNFPLIWVKAHEQFYKDTTLRHQVVTDQHEYARRDLFAELVEPCRKRGMKLYARVLESSAMARL